MFISIKKIRAMKEEAKNLIKVHGEFPSLEEWRRHTIRLELLNELMLE